MDPGIANPTGTTLRRRFLIFVHIGLDERLYLYDLLSPIDR